MEPEDLARILDDLGQRLGPTGEYVFALAVRQQFIASLLWTVVAGTVLVVAVGILIRSLRRFQTFEDALAAIDTANSKRDSDTADVRAAIREYETAKQAAHLEAMTPKEREAWYERQRMFNSWGGFGYGHYDVESFHEANGTHRLTALVAGIVAGVAVFVLLWTVPVLLVPEYAAIRDILGAIGGSR